MLSRGWMRIVSAMSAISRLIRLVAATAALAAAAMLLAPTAVAARPRKPSPPQSGPFVYDNGTGWYGTGLPSQDVATPFDDRDREAADDFVVPASTSWSIETVTVEGFTTASPSGLSVDPDRFILTVYADAGGAPGAIVVDPQTVIVMTKTAGSSRSGGGETDRYALAPSPVRLGAGRYWLSVRAPRDYLTEGQWTWLDTAPYAPTGRGAMFKSTAPECQSWCAQPVDLTFRLDGHATTT
jgi:hypothetical protein